MVHNGIEYGDMQLICEAYHLMKSALGLSPDEMSKVNCFWLIYIHTFKWFIHFGVAVHTDDFQQ